VAGSITNETKALIVACFEIRWNDHRYSIKPDSQSHSPESAYLLVLELNQGVVILDNLVAEVLGLWKELGQTVPLTSHLVSVYDVSEELTIRDEDSPLA
jgi:hypothetical protein